jgi:arylsulfatase A
MADVAAGKKEGRRMQNRIFKFFTAGCFLAGAQAGHADNGGRSAPNIILILTDDQGWSQTSGLMDPLVPESGSGYLMTPNIDRIAQEGLRFTSGYAPAPLCTPTRRSILCGTSAARSGTEFPSETGWIPHQRMTIPKALRMVNPEYRCAHFGKWGGRHMISTPEECGYDASSGVTDNPEGGMPDSFGYGSHDETPPFFIDNEDPKRSFSVSDDSADFIREQVAANRPFYVQASYYAPHLSVVCKEDTLIKYLEKGTPDRGYTQAFAAMLEDMDSGIGRILDVVDELGIGDNTYIFFMSDNGGRGQIPGGDPERLPTNYPLTGSKQSLYEGGIRVPFMVRGPGIPQQSVCRVPVSGYDLLPTFFDLAGGSSALPEYIDGGSMKPLLLNPDSGAMQRPRDALFFHRPKTLVSSVRQGDYKLMLLWNSLGTVRSSELYHLNLDPREAGRNITAENPEKAEQLQTMLLEYLQEVGAYSPPAPVLPGSIEGAVVIYANDFSGFVAGDPGLSATVNPGLGYTANQVSLNGEGHLVSTGTAAGSGFRVQLSEAPLVAPAIKLTAAMRALTSGSWIGIGFHGENVQKLNDSAANGGPWLLITDKSVRVRGGTAVSGSNQLYQNTHVAGGILTIEMTYYTETKAVDLSLNGIAVVKGLALVHEFPEGTPSDPSIKFLQVQLWNDLDDTAYIDSVTVETLPKQAAGFSVEVIGRRK